MSTKDISDAEVIRAYQLSALVHKGAIYTIEGERPQWPEDFLMVQTRQCFKVCYRAMERACKRGYVEYGTSLRSGWITTKGFEKISGAKQ